MSWNGCGCGCIAAVQRKFTTIATNSCLPSTAPSFCATLLASQFSLHFDFPLLCKLCAFCVYFCRQLTFPPSFSHSLQLPPSTEIDFLDKAKFGKQSPRYNNNRNRIRHRQATMRVPSIGLGYRWVEEGVGSLVCFTCIKRCQVDSTWNTIIIAIECCLPL